MFSQLKTEKNLMKTDVLEQIYIIFQGLQPQNSTKAMSTLYRL